MHFYKMTIIEETASEYRNELTLWDTDKSKIWIQIGEDTFDDPHALQGMAITVDDARALMNELNRLISIIGNTELSLAETREPEVIGSGNSLKETSLSQKVNWTK